MPIPTPPGGIENMANDEGGRGMPSNDTGGSRSGSPGAAGGPEMMGADAGGRGTAPNTSMGFGPGSDGGPRTMPNRSR